MKPVSCGLSVFLDVHTHQRELDHLQPLQSEERL